LYGFEPSSNEDEVRSVSAQFVRKISGFTKPSIVNAAALETISAYVYMFSDQLAISALKKNREIEAAKRYA